MASDWSRARRVVYVFGLAGAYTLVLGTALPGAGAWWPIATFWALTANRALDTLVRGPPGSARLMEMAGPWAGTIALFVAVAVVAGTLGAKRQAVFYAGAVYFAANAVSELGNWWWARRWLRRDPARPERRR